MGNIQFWINVIIAILSGVATAIPLIIKLVETVQDAVKAKNWTPLMQIVLRLMQEAEENYSTGADRKEYVMDSVVAMKDSLNYEIDLDAISSMIDSIVAASKQINVK